MTLHFKKKHYTVTEIVATVYCEQKVVFDRTHDKATDSTVRAKAAAGEFEHKRFQAEGYTKLVRSPLRLIDHLAASGKYRKRYTRDSRCFIATSVYGPHAAETEFLRAWRDRLLLPSPTGRFAVRLYYALSPFLVPLLARSELLTKYVRIALDDLLRRLGMPP